MIKSRQNIYKKKRNKSFNKTNLLFLRCLGCSFKPFFSNKENLGTNKKLVAKDNQA